MNSYAQELTVQEQHTAKEIGSGILYVFSTPSMVAFMENTATHAVGNLEKGYTTVGIEINVQHLKASKIGETLTCRADLIRQDGRLYEFKIVAHNAKNEEIGIATHKRMKVNEEKFMSKL